MSVPTAGSSSSSDISSSGTDSEQQQLATAAWQQQQRDYDRRFTGLSNRHNLEFGRGIDGVQCNRCHRVCTNGERNYWSAHPCVSPLEPATQRMLQELSRSVRTRTGESGGSSFTGRNDRHILPEFNDNGEAPQWWLPTQTAGSTWEKSTTIK